MAFDAEQRKMNDILSGDFKYIIPRYQRKYVWQEKQWRELIDDIKYCLDAATTQDDAGVEWTHFLGSFVFERQGKDLIVIDGQQRLTTITIMLCAICTLYSEFKDEAHFRGVKKYIIGTDDMGADYVRVDNQDLKNYQYIVAETTRYNPLLSGQSLATASYLEKSPQDNVNVKECFYFFYSQFQERIQNFEQPIDELNNIKDKIMGLDVIDIRATNQRESYNIFEILNARGVDLKQHELIKNYIFKYIHSYAKIDPAKLKWDVMETKLYIEKRSVMDSFFTHYIAHRFEKPDKDNTEFRIVKQYCDRTHMEELLDDLAEKACYYRMFYCPSECDNIAIRKTLQFFADKNHRQFRPLFLSAISAYKKGKITEREAELFFQLLNNFYFGYGVVCGGKSNTIDDIVYEYALKIENEDAHSAMRELKLKLQQYYPDYSTFESNFILLGWSHSVKYYKTMSKKKIVQYILSSIEEHFLNQNGELAILKFSLEHIANDDGTISHCTIGNLLMLAEPINGNAQDRPFAEKLSFYEKSNFISTKNFVNRNKNINEWENDQIEKRGKYMARLAYNEIWKFEC